MTLIEIAVLLEVAVHGKTSIHATDSEVGRLVAAGFIAPQADEEKPMFKATEKGLVYVEAIRSVPMPTQIWTCELVSMDQFDDRTNVERYRDALMEHELDLQSKRAHKLSREIDQND